MGHKSSGSTTKTTQTQDNWLSRNPAYQAMVNQVISESAHYNVPEYQLAAENDVMKNALNNLGQGLDLKGYQTAQDYFTNLGQAQTTAGQAGLANAQGVLNQFQNMTHEQYQAEMQKEYNSDLVNQQIAEMKADVNENAAQAVEGLNQQATSSGNMGSSRAGVAQGVIQGKAMRAIASGSAQIRGAEENAAMQRLSQYMNTRTGAASANAQIAQGQMTTGLGAYGQGLNAYNAFNQAQVNQWNNQLTAGNYQRQLQQQQIDLSRQNELLRQSPALQRLMMANQGLGPIANWSTSGTSVQKTQQAGGGNGMMGGIMGAVGTGVGAYFGGPMGASMGGALGSSIGGAM